MLASLNMYGKSSGPSQDVKFFNKQSYVSASLSGIFYSDYKAGDFVQKEAIVGYTTDEFGKVIEKHQNIKTKDTQNKKHKNKRKKKKEKKK